MTRFTRLPLCLLIPWLGACSHEAPGPDLNPSADLTGIDLAGADLAPSADAAAPPTGGRVKAVFLILMENSNWSDIKGSSSAPYINKTLLPMASHAERYTNPPGVHPSEPNYLWLEAGTNFRVLDDKLPSVNHQGTTAHLVTQLKAAGISWRAYQEDISGTDCPLTNVSLFVPRHLPMLFFDDVTGGNDRMSAECISHVRPYGELAADLAAGRVARYNFLTPNLCNDMHNTVGCPSLNHIKNGDDWLSREVPKLLASDAYKDDGLILITWDESENGDHPIGLIALSPLGKGGGYSNTIPYTHGSTLRTLQEIFGVRPLLRDAATATSLSDLFNSY